MNYSFLLEPMPVKQKLLLTYYNAFIQGKPGDKDLSTRREKAAKGTKLAAMIFDKKIKVKSIDNKLIDGRHGDIPIRIYEPFSNPRSAAIIYIHGGGFVQLSIDTHDFVCRRLCEMNKAKVISIEYRLAPENKFPIPLDDCYDATNYVIDNSIELNIDRSKIVIAGDSAGGNLATAVCLQRKANDLAKLAGQVLIYPCLDARLIQDSVNKYKTGFLLTKEVTTWYVKQYCRSEEDITNPLVSPLFAEDCSHLPPSFILSAGLDILQDEAKLYAKKLEEDGVPTKFKHYKELLHGFVNFPLIANNAMQAYRDINLFIDEVII